MGEFDLIQQYFADRALLGTSGKDLSRIPLGIGDDCALINGEPHNSLAISTDMFIEGRHFFAGTDAYDIGYKSLAVNLSDLAAMGAKPTAFTLALALPKADESFLQGFSDGLFTLANQFNCRLVGGDTTRGPLNICITVFGDVPAALALRRNGAKPGDDLWVSGELGAPAFAVRERYANRPLTADTDGQKKLLRPTPRIELGLALRSLAHSALDLSDGLQGDLRHICKLSAVAVEVDCSLLPVASSLQHLPELEQWQLAVGGGDDYELAFTAVPANRAAIQQLSIELDVSLTRIGRVVEGDDLRFFDRQAQPVSPKIVAQWCSFDHFN